MVNTLIESLIFFLITRLSILFLLIRTDGQIKRRGRDFRTDAFSDEPIKNSDISSTFKCCPCLFLFNEDRHECETRKTIQDKMCTQWIPLYNDITETSLIWQEIKKNFYHNNEDQKKALPVDTYPKNFALPKKFCSWWTCSYNGMVAPQASTYQNYKYYKTNTERSILVSNLT